MKPSLCGSLGVLAIAGLQGCCLRPCNGSTSVDAPAPFTPLPVIEITIVDWGPRETSAGVPFNVQPDGRAAIWVQVDQSLDGRIALIQIGDAFLEAHPSGKVVSATVPGASYAQPGSYQVRVLARSERAQWQSGEVHFRVD